MVREHLPKKPVGRTLEEIKEKLREKRNKQLARAAATSRTLRSRLAHPSGSSAGGATPGGLLKAVQQNNLALALALQAEKEKVRQANAVVLRLTRERQDLLLHLLLLKRTLHERRAVAASSPLVKTSEPRVEADEESPRRESVSECNTAGCQLTPICAASPKMDARPDADQIAPPPAVMAKRRHGEGGGRTSGRRSDRVRERHSVSEAYSGALVSGPPARDEGRRETTTTEAAPAEDDRVRARDYEPTGNARKHAPRRPRPKADGPLRGRKPERAPLKKPWENPKRVRSKSRDRSAPPPQQLNTSLGFNDTFDFDCEEAVHLTPFKAKPDHPEPPAPQPSSLSPESADSLYMPKKKSKRGRPSLETTEAIATRRGLAPPKGHEPTRTRVDRRECGRDGSRSRWPPVGFFQQSSPDDASARSSEAGHCGRRLPLGQRPGGRRDDDRRRRPVPFGDSLCPAPPPPSSPLASIWRRVTTREKRGLWGSALHDAAGRNALSRLSDVTNLSSPAATRPSTPAAARVRRRTVAMNYKEPSLSTKLRRGDKFTDVRFLPPGSPIFKKSRRSRASTGARHKLDKYNESFVGCR
ncbi:LOW QUALITY PROTEIN: shugoshin 1 [Phycodurus eques]|uniref:LOW QUALITY PROTEIN: shugoshin 1 n=1 Tax=Phycodurus eques TaxID=693459 RepID=UPI002ACECB83|nr:LOW QUALITY PROTEIN: shugoshin 1 [Phycodurus eques]